MSSLSNVAIHSSQFPEAVYRELLKSLRDRAINHKFHYDSYKQARKWLAVHRAYSPYQTDADCERIYAAGFEAVCAACESEEALDVIGLGCGGGQKDIALLRALRAGGAKLSYVPCDVSMPLVLIAGHGATDALKEVRCAPLVCDLQAAEDLCASVESLIPHRGRRVVTFFGMIPNFEPASILGRLAHVFRPGDLLLFSANLAPGAVYDAGIRQVLPLYDNVLTRDWLTTFLFDLGVDPGDGLVSFRIEEYPPGTGCKRIAAYFEFELDRHLELGDESVTFRSGDNIRLFFSYRYTPAQVRDLLARHGLGVMSEWVAPSEEEGVFLCRASR